MKKLLVRLINKYFIIPKYERKINKLLREKEELCNNLDYIQSRMYYYKRKCLERKREEVDKNAK